MRIKVISIFLMFILVFINGCGKNNQPKQKTMNPDWMKNLAIYEVNLRQYTEEGTFQAFENHLPKLKELGVGIIWLMPIHPIGEKNRKGSLGSYYSVKDYFAVNPEFGTMEDFKRLVNKIHDLGMYVIIDWVANHCAWDNSLLIDHPDWFTKDKNGNMIPPVDDWTDVVDFNYDNLELRQYMTDALKFWIEEANIDGYRCDVAEMVPFDFWKPAIEELRKIKPILMLAEADSPDCHKNGFDATYGWDVYHMFNDIASKKKDVQQLYELLKIEMNHIVNGVYRMNFTSNHDENSWNGTVFERLGDGAETFAALTFMIPGMPLIYNGQESGLNKRLSFFEKDLIDWKKNQFSELYKSLISFYNENKCLHDEATKNNIELIKTTDKKHVLLILRISNSKKVLSIFNLSPNSVSFKIQDFNHEDIFQSVYPEKNSKLKINTSIELKPWEFQFYKN